MKKQLIIYGANHPEPIKILDEAKKSGAKVEVLGFIDDVKFGRVESYMGYPILGDKKFVSKYGDKYFINNVFKTTKDRETVQAAIGDKKMYSVIWPYVCLTYCSLGSGLFVGQNVSFGANVVISNHASIRDSAVISHDVYLGEYASVSPGAVLCGRVHIEYGAYIGAGAVVREDITIGANAVVGAGAVVVKNVPANTVVVGVPAKPIKT